MLFQFFFISFWKSEIHKQVLWIWFVVYSKVVILIFFLGMMTPRAHGRIDRSVLDLGSDFLNSGFQNSDQNIEHRTQYVPIFFLHTSMFFMCEQFPNCVSNTFYLRVCLATQCEMTLIIYVIYMESSEVPDIHVFFLADKYTQLFMCY